MLPTFAPPPLTERELSPQVHGADRRGADDDAPSEKDAKLTQTLGQLQPFLAVFLQGSVGIQLYQVPGFVPGIFVPGTMGQLAYFGPT
jgi:hypothetical protein